MFSVCPQRGYPNLWSRSFPGGTQSLVPGPFLRVGVSQSVVPGLFPGWCISVSGPRSFPRGKGVPQTGPRKGVPPDLEQDRGTPSATTNQDQDRGYSSPPLAWTKTGVPPHPDSTDHRQDTLWAVHLLQ